MHVVTRSLIAAAAAVALTSTTIQAQATGRIAGVVRNESGQPLEAARITISSPTSGVARSTTTGPDGAYGISGLPEGFYTVSAALFGYRRATRTAVRVPASEQVDFTLEPLPLQAITVTATLREQELADVPFSVAAPTASVLRERGAETLEAIAANVAGFSVQNLGPGQSQVGIRGTSSGQIARDQPGVKEQVGVYLDDSPVSLSLFTPDLDLFDVSRVEVLRGPQGTLFGAGSLAGTVRYISNQPELGVRNTFGEVGGSWIGGGSGGAQVKVGTNVPLTDRAAARVAVYHSLMGGYIDAVQPDLRLAENLNHGQRTGARAAVRFAPNQRLSITPRLVYQRVRMEGWNRIDTFNILANPYTTSRPQVTLGDRRQFTQIPEPFTDDFVLGDVNVRYDLGAVNLTSVTSYSYRDILVVRDAGALTSSITGGSIGLPEEIYTLDAPLDDATRVNVLTQEVRFAGGADRVRWVAGAFYSTNSRKYAQSLMVGGFEAASGIPTRGLRAERDELFYSDLSYDMRQSALFGEATATLANRLDVTVGLRHYNFSEDREQYFDGLFGNDDNGNTVVSVPGSTSASGLAPRFIASFRATDRVTLNAQAARGFRLGGINDPLNEPLCTPEDLATFRGRDSWRDEKAWNYEVGAKSQWMDGRASLNVSAFHMDIEDLQLTVTAGSCSSRLVFNVPRATSRGAEIEFAVAPTSFLDLAASATMTDSKLNSTLTSTDASGNVSVVAGIEEGNRLPSVPEFQASGAATLRRPLRPGSQGFFTATAQHIGSRYTQIDDHAIVSPLRLDTFGGNTIGGPLTQDVFPFTPLLPAYTVVNLRAGISRASWETALFISNVTDERAFLALDRERGLRARVGYLTNQPRTFGVSMRFDY